MTPTVETSFGALRVYTSCDDYVSLMLISDINDITWVWVWVERAALVCFETD